MREIVLVPSKILRQKCEPVKEITPELIKEMNEMFETMYGTYGAGLAGPQIGICKRIITMDTESEYDHETRELIKEGRRLYIINPEIIEKSKETQTIEEGCLSVPGGSGEVTRPRKVKFKYTDENNKEQVMELEDFYASCVQHEIDHLEGILYIDYLSKLKRDKLIKKVRKAQKARG